MTREEAQLILGVYRPGTSDADDPFFAEALALALTDQELGRWFADEQSFDQIIATNLSAATSNIPEPPAALLESLRSAPGADRVVSWNFRRALALAACVALLAALATYALVPRGFDSSVSLADFRSEMVGFVKIPPSLELETTDLAEVRSYLRANSRVRAVSVPDGTGELPPIGCRTLVFRGHPVALICFKREDGELVHLLAAPRDAIGELASLPKPAYAAVGDWATASWTTDDQIYLLATKGNREKLQEYL